MDNDNPNRNKDTGNIPFINVKPSDRELSGNCTDMGNAYRFIGHTFSGVRFCYQRNKWMVWDGKRWVFDGTGQINARAQLTVLEISLECENISDREEQERRLKHAERSQQRDRINAMLELAKPMVPIDPEHFDKDPMLLNVLNGVVDLNMGNLIPHSRDLFMTKMAPVTYVEGAECPNWQKHLRRIFDGDEGSILFLQKAFGYSLTGRTDASVFFVLWGSGANGKSVTIDVFARILGDYAMRTRTETLLLKKHDGIGNDVARLKGARFVYASEVEDGRRLAEALVKDLSGGDTVTARFLWGEHFEFKPEMKLWLATNHRPVIRGTEEAIWRRIRLIPFEVTIPEKDRIPQKEFVEMMMAEAPGILNWGIEGCRLVVKDNFQIQPCEKVKRATQVYRDEMDVARKFFEECCINSPLASTAAGEIYRAYLAWCRSIGEKPISSKALAMRLEERGFTKERTKKGVRYLRIGLRD